MTARAIGALLAAALLGGCSRPSSADADANARIWSGGVAKIAEAPDGTTLWAVRDYGRTVYFASAGGVQWGTTESCGKNCTKTVQHDVPTAIPMAR